MALPPNQIVLVQADHIGTTNRMHIGYMQDHPRTHTLQPSEMVLQPNQIILFLIEWPCGQVKWLCGRLTSFGIQNETVSLISCSTDKTLRYEMSVRAKHALGPGRFSIFFEERSHSDHTQTPHGVPFGHLKHI